MKKIVSLLWLFAAVFPAAGQKLQPDARLVSRMISDTTFEIVPGLQETDLRYLNKAGKPMAVYILEADLRKHKLVMEAATPFNKDTFCRQTVTEQMKWENGPGHRVVAGINADFFNMKNGVPEEMAFKEESMLKDGIGHGRGFTGVLKNGRVIIGDSLLYVKKKNRLKEALGGSRLLVKKGQVMPQLHNSFSLTHHPRTALGIIGRRKVIFVVVDGRQPEYANGMPLDHLAWLMKSLGARAAINLDGGGSSTLVSGDPAKGKWVIRNRPSDGQARKVANAWIIVDSRAINPGTGPGF